MTDQPDITPEHVAKALAKAGGVIRTGEHGPPNGDCHACVRELRTLALWEAGVDLEWTDTPDVEMGTKTDGYGEEGTHGNLDVICQYLNDAEWPSDEARTKHCLPLVYLSEHTAPEGWQDRFVENVRRRVLPLRLVDLGFPEEAKTLTTGGEVTVERLKEIWNGRQAYALPLRAFAFPYGRVSAADVAVDVSEVSEEHLLVEAVQCLLDACSEAAER